MSAKMSRNPLLLILASGALILGACGQDSSSSRTTETAAAAPAQAGSAPAAAASPAPAEASGQAASPQANHPCALLTNADAEAVLGKLQRPPVEADQGGAHSCTWDSAAGHVTLLTAGTPDGITFLKSQFGAEGGSRNQDVPGVGDNAGWLEGGHYMLVKKGGTYFVLVGTPPPFTLDAAKSLAQKVIARL